jgi:hypothetical protein
MTEMRYSRQKRLATLTAVFENRRTNRDRRSWLSIAFGPGQRMTGFGIARSAIWRPRWVEPGGWNSAHDTNVLAALRDYGFILAASLEPAPPGYKSLADPTIRLHNP